MPMDCTAYASSWSTSPMRSRTGPQALRVSIACRRRASAACAAALGTVRASAARVVVVAAFTASRRRSSARCRTRASGRPPSRPMPERPMPPNGRAQVAQEPGVDPDDADAHALGDAVAAAEVASSRPPRRGRSRCRWPARRPRPRCRTGSGAATGPKISSRTTRCVLSRPGPERRLDPGAVGELVAERRGCRRRRGRWRPRCGASSKYDSTFSRCCCEMSGPIVVAGSSGRPRRSARSLSARPDDHSSKIGRST